jgi:hypothetical protein
MRRRNRTFNTLKREDSRRTPEARRMSIDLRTARALKAKGL